ncbi:hypothetical protein BLNAU_23530 [Blattamonas nauphoetae]|uniref:Tyrosine-protein kinase ephrin type A/B receptor-like domain-containing protein n=1 Tax=Blattamonas nauphoetae TaxID=2049346 RepID=A0ABQ9WQ12_9EUKA|nr:hypothetical protein BLNAU_23530 [Blattamonas nauphoetae]
MLTGNISIILIINLLPRPSRLVRTVSVFSGASRGYHCVSCPAGTYAPTAGATECLPCSDPNGWCPVGSRTNNASIPTEPDGMSARVKEFQTLDNIQDWLLIGPYLGGFVLGIVVASILRCCPCLKKWFWKLDLLDGYHHTQVNRVTRVSEKVLRKSVLGACVFIVFICFTVGTITTVLLEFFLNNKTETISTLVELSLPANEEMKKMETDFAEIGLVLLQMNRACTTDDVKAVEDGKWDLKSRGEYATPNITCSLLSSNTTLRDPTVDCLVRLNLTSLSFAFDGSSVDPSISFSVSDDEASAYGFAAYMRAETNREKNPLDANSSISGQGAFILDDKGRMFKGPDPTVFNFDLMRSQYKAADNEQFYGLFISKVDVEAGTTSDFDEIYSKFGLEVQLLFEKDPSVILVERVYRTKVAELFATLFSTAMGFMGAFGALCRWWGEVADDQLEAMPLLLSIVQRRYGLFESGQ